METTSSIIEQNHFQPVKFQDPNERKCQKSVKIIQLVHENSSIIS